MFTQLILDPLRGAIARLPDRDALFIGEEAHTYREFAGRIAAIRRALRDAPIIHPTVGLVANDDVDTYASIFALWLEGLAYVPLHPQHPAARGREIIGQADIDLVIDSSDRPLFPDMPLIDSRRLDAAAPDLEPAPASDNALAYLLFTSGSTGRPKGVPITRRNLGAFMQAFWATGIRIGPGDRCLQCFDLTFDASVQSYLAPLTTGACAYTVPHGRIKFSSVCQLLTDHRITVSVLAPSMIRYLRPYFDELHLPDVRYTFLIGEASPVDLIGEWAACVPQARIINFYGPTEATVYCTFYEFMREGPNKHFNGMLAIGRPMCGMHAVIVDERRTILGANRKGELCVSGDQVMPGYWKDPEKTDAAFFETGRDGRSARFYRTGDYGYIDDDGDLLLGGRMDLQVKIHGFRVELGEIEYHARLVLRGANAAALTADNDTGNSEIVLFVEQPSIDEAELTGHLRGALPAYMIPTKIVATGAFPLNANGKVDRLALKRSLDAFHA